MPMIAESLKKRKCEYIKTSLSYPISYLAHHLEAHWIIFLLSIISYIILIKVKSKLAWGELREPHTGVMLDVRCYG
jgi:hypothetical protein